MNAKKETIDRGGAIELAREVDEIYASKGKQVLHIHVKRDKPSDAELEAALVGPTGNLRAPTVRKGRTLVVGFDANTYAKLLAK